MLHKKDLMLMFYVIELLIAVKIQPLIGYVKILIELQGVV